MNTTLKFIASLMLFSLNLGATSLLSGEISRTYTSDDLDIHTKSIKILSNRRDLFWNYQDEDESANDIGAELTNYSGSYLGEDLSSQSGQLILGRKWNARNYTSLSVGGHKLEFEGESFSIVNWTLSQFMIFESYRAKFSLNRDFQFIGQQIPQSLNEGLQKDEVSLFIEYIKFENFRIPLTVSKSFISDDNNSQEIDLSVLYGRSYPVWWWIGYGAYSLKYADRTLGYWSPNNFRSHGPRFELGYPLTEKLQAIAGFNYSFIKEDNFKAGTSKYQSLGLQYGIRNDGLISLSWIDINSQQESNTWTSRGFTLLFEKSI